MSKISAALKTNLIIRSAPAYVIQHEFERSNLFGYTQFVCLWDFSGQAILPPDTLAPTREVNFSEGNDMAALLSDLDVIDKVFDHVDNKTTDMGAKSLRVPIEHYTSQERFDAEIELMKRMPSVFCPVAALPEAGSYVARTALGTPLLAVRDDAGDIRVFRNACRHRGMAVAEDGCGTKRGFVCPYHAWLYGLDGGLKRIPDEDGFPDVDKATSGLVEVHSEIKGGLVFVTQDKPISRGALDAMPERITPNQQFMGVKTLRDKANWKLIGETSMEGYHIRWLHTHSFYPYGMDNVNIVETSGPNSRIIFPFRRMEKLRDIPREKRRMDGMATLVYQLFPNAHYTVLSSHTLVIILEPISPTETEWVIYDLSNDDGSGEKKEISAKAEKDAKFVKETGLKEDRDAACSVQASLASGANTHLTFGKFEQAIVHFHEQLDERLAQLKAASG